MTTCLVTGGAGFIGSHLAEALVRRGFHVRVLDNLSSGRIDNLAAIRDVEFIEGSITHRDTVRKAMQGVERVFHFAALASVPVSMAKPELAVEVNTLGTTLVMNAAAESGVRSFVNISSAAIYGDAPELPKREEMAPKPLSPYALTKLVSEQTGALYTRCYDLPVASLRFFNVFGPRQRPDSDYAAVVPKFLEAAAAGVAPTIFGDGRQTRDFIFVEDAVEATILASECSGAAGQAFNIASGRVYNLLDLMDAVNRAMGTRLEPMFGPTRVGDIKDSAADVTKAERVLGFRARYSLQEGIERSVHSGKPG